MPKIKAYILFVFICLPVQGFTEAGMDTGTDENSAGITDVNIAAETDKSKVLEETKKIEEAKTVIREVDAVIGKRGVIPIGYRDFFYPTYHGMRLSYCTEDNKTCGKKLASKYCKLLGYNRASKIMIEHNVGLTRYPSTNLQCQGWKCDGFKLITCEDSLKKTPTPVYYYRMRDFTLPRFENYRIAWCYHEKKGCGRRAANAFCRQQGYEHSRGYERSSTEVASTRTIGSGALCFGQACKGFERITCYR